MVRLTISLADRTHRALKEAAVRQNRSMAAIIEESLKLRGIQPFDSAREIVAKSLEIAAEICIYTNRHTTIETL